MSNFATINSAAIAAGTAADEEAYQLWLRDPAAPCMHLVRINYHGDSADYPSWNTYTLKLSDAPFPPYNDRVKSIPSFSRQIGDELAGVVSASIGSIVLHNEDGALDLWHNLSLDGQDVEVLHGHPDWIEERFRTLYRAVAEAVASSTADELSIRVRGIDYGSDKPIQTNLIPPGVGANAAASTPVPLAFGQVFNITPAVIDEVNQVYQWNDGAVTSVSDVRDSGVRFRTAQIAISAVDAGNDLLSTAAAHGFYRGTRIRCDVGTLPSVASWGAMAWNGEVFCAVASGSTVCATSPDGVHWTAGTMPANAPWSSVSWNGEVFCAVASNSTACATSPDGLNWTAGTMPTSINWRSIAWNGAVFCAIAFASSVCATSPDGITWTAGTMPYVVSANWYAIAWNGEVFCAIQAGYDPCATSPDGQNWTPGTLPSSSNWAAIAWGGTVFCATSATDGVAATSPDGLNWTAQSVGSMALAGTIAWNGSVFCATGYSGVFGYNVATSPDGVTWTEGSMPAVGWYAQAWNGEVFCAISAGSTYAVVSDDGLAWSPITNTLPAPLAINTDYWVMAEGLTTTDYKLTDEWRGTTPVNLTGTDTGAPLIGFHWTADLTTGKIYLDSKPSGVLTMDGIAGSTLAATILPTVLDAVNVDALSQTVFGTTCPQVIGLYVAERANRLALAEEIVAGLGAWYGYSRHGMLRFGRVEATYTDHELALIEGDGAITDALSIERMIPPRKRNRVRYRRNWTNQSGALVADVSTEARNLYSTDYSVSAPTPLGDDEGPAGEQFHALAVLPDAKDSLIYYAGDAATEGVRRDELYYGWGAIFNWQVGRVGSEADIGMVIHVTHSRFNLSGGVRMVAVGVEDRPSDGTTVLKLFAPLAAYAPGQL